MCNSELSILNILDSEVPETPFNEDDRDPFLINIWLGIINTRNLDITTYGKTVAYLMNAVKNGYGGFADNFTFGSGLSDLAKGLERNIWEFSAAKQYQEVRTLSKMIFRGQPFEEFKPLADIVWKDYNETWLKSEWVTGVQQAQSAREWQDFQDNDDVQFLRYHTQRDSRVRSEHAALEGIIRAKNDPFWNNYAPKNGWRCRCFLTGQETTKKVTDLSKKKIPVFGDKDFPKEFKMNAGKDKFIFSKRHPYFKVSKGDLTLKNNNFNLPLPR